MSVREKNLIANQTVCSLDQLLRLASYYNTTVVFRLRRPPAMHPCYHSWINDTLQVVLQSGVPQSLVSGQNQIIHQTIMWMEGNSALPPHLIIISLAGIETSGTVSAHFLLCAGDVDPRWGQSSGETAGTWSGPNLGGETKPPKSPWRRHQQAATPIQPGQHRGHRVGTQTLTRYTQVGHQNMDLYSKK